MNVPIQTANIQLPGAEFFSLAPNRVVAIGGRRRFTTNTSVISVPASSAAFNINEASAGVGNLIMESPFPQSAGIYIHKADLLMIPIDFSLQLQIVSCGFGFRTNSSTTTSYFPIGNALLNFATPSNSQQIAATDRELLVTERDIELYSTPPLVSPGVLQAAFLVTVANKDGAAAHSVQVAARYIYTRLDGFVE